MDLICHLDVLGFTYDKILRKALMTVWYHEMKWDKVRIFKYLRISIQQKLISSVSELIKETPACSSPARELFFLPVMDRVT